jgi:hypothetical protein
MKLKLPHPHLPHHTSSYMHVKEKQYRQNDPARPWHRLLLVTLVLVILSIVFHFILYVRINRGSVVETAGDTGAEKIHEEKLTFILEYFGAKMVRYEQEKIVAPLVSDPSL